MFFIMFFIFVVYIKVNRVTVILNPPQVEFSAMRLSVGDNKNRPGMKPVRAITLSADHRPVTRIFTDSPR